MYGHQINHHRKFALFFASDVKLYIHIIVIFIAGGLIAIGITLFDDPVLILLIKIVTSSM